MMSGPLRPSAVFHATHDRLGRTAAARRGRHFDDTGMTLTELLIASTLLIVLLTVVMTTMSVVDSISNSVSAQYQEFDQALPALAPLQALLRAEIEPAPTAYQTGAASPPTPAFASVGNFALTFYSDIGTAYHNVQTVPGSNPPQVTTAGPAKIVAEELDQSGNPVTTATSCSTSSPCSFQVREYLPITKDGASTCPVTGESPTNVCQYPTSYTLVTNALDVINNPSSGTHPIFTYSVFDPDFGGGTAFTMTTADVSNQQITGLAALGYPTDATQTTNTTPPTFACLLPDTSYPTIAVSCPTDAIQSVGVNLVISAKGAGSSKVNNQTIVYRYPESAGASAYPYQYSSAEG